MPRAPLFRRSTPLILALALLGTAVTPTVAWNNGGNDPGYGTHDWVIDAAARVLNGRADGWFDAAVARQHSDDPDNVGSTGHNDHVYRDTGARGGAVHRIAEHHAAAVRHHRAGRYRDASREIGLMSHYLSDVMMPWHSHYDGIGARGHLEYEQRVGAETRSASDRPDWASSRRTVSAVPNVRTTAVAAAAYSRGFFPELYGRFTADPTTLTPACRRSPGRSWSARPTIWPT